MSEQQFFIRQGEKVQGPFSVERIRGWIAAGRMHPEMELSEDGTSFRRGDQIPGLFDAPVADDAVRAPAREARAGSSGPRTERPRSAPAPTVSVVAIACRVLAVIGLFLALGVGQWAFIAGPNERPDSGGPDSRIIFGLTGFSINSAVGPNVVEEGTVSYAEMAAVDRDAGPKIDRMHSFKEPEVIDAAGTSRTFGVAIGGLLLIAALLTLASFAEMFGKPRMSLLASFGLLAALAATAVGWLFSTVGLPRVLRDKLVATVPGAPPPKVSGAFSFYLLILCVLILAIGWTRSRVVAMDDARRLSRPPPPKRRRKSARPAP
jgi:hypothetical protein